MRRTRALALMTVLMTAMVLAGDVVGSAVAARAHRRAAPHPATRSWCSHHSSKRCGSLFSRRLPDNARVAPDSAAIIGRMFSTGTGQVAPVQLNPAPGHDWGDAIFYSRPSDPLYRIHCDKPVPGSCPAEGWEIHIPALARPADGGDALMSVISRTSGLEYDFWNVQTNPLPPHGGTIVVGWGGYSNLHGWNAGSGASCGGAGSCTVMSKGLITYADLARGRINHAVYLVVNCSNGRTVYPAWSGNSGGGECDDPTNAPAWGQWFQLRMSDREIDRLRAPQWLKAIYRAFAHYGAMAYDAGSNGAFDIQVQSPQSFTAMRRPNPFIRWASQQQRQPRSHVGAYVSDGGKRYWLDFGGGIDWASKLRVVAPCVIAGTC